MSILTKAAFSGLYLTSGGQWPDNATGDISPQDLRNGIADFFDSQVSNWYADTSGILASDTTGFAGADFNAGIAAPAHKEGRVFYDSTNHTFAVYNDMSDVTLQLGQETHIRAVNKTGSDIPNGTVVSIVGAQGNRPKIEPAIAAVDYNFTDHVVGLATHLITDNQEGLVTVQGTVGGVDTRDFSEGAELFLSATASGTMSGVAPEAPDHVIHIGHALNSTVNGTVLVTVNIGSNLEELYNVNGNTAKEGYILGYDNASGYWNPTNQINTSGGFIFGDTVGGNYSEFQEDTGFHRAYGSGRAWDDLRFPFNGAKLDTSAGRVDYNFTDNTVDFADNATSADLVNMICQMHHDWAQGTNVHPHIHWIQNQDVDPAWRMDYRVYDNGTQVPAWTTGVSPSTARQFTYTSGNMLQITEFPVISGATDLSGFGVSWFMDVKIYRVGASDSYSGDAAAKEFDLHYLRDDRGSRQEYIK